MSESTNVIIVTREGVNSKDGRGADDFDIMEHSRKEEDTLMIFAAAKLHRVGMKVHVYSTDTDVLVLALSMRPNLGYDTKLIMNMGGEQKNVALQPIYHALGTRRIAALRGFHAIRGCDTTGRTYGKSKSA